jgi:formyltetrahydrofolate-dependent phosphoribosylglycinamide formyltransferase
MTLKIGVLGSTKGTDMQAIIDAIESGDLDAEIVCVISDKEDAFILERAKEHGIEAIDIQYEGKRRVLFDKAAAKEFDDRGAELVLLIGFMRILSPWFCKHYENRVMNIHPSLLPLFAGGVDINVHEEVLNKGIKVTGCTLHFVTPKIDAGPIIMQKPVMVEDSDTPDTLKEKVQQAEQEVLIEAIQKFGEGKIKVEGSRVKIA